MVTISVSTQKHHFFTASSQGYYLGHYLWVERDSLHMSSYITQLHMWFVFWDTWVESHTAAKA